MDADIVREIEFSRSLRGYNTAEVDAFLERMEGMFRRRDLEQENLEKKLQGLSRVKLYLEDSQEDRLAVLKAFAQEKHLPITVAPLPETDWEESWKDNYPPQEVGKTLVVLPYWLADSYETDRKKVILDPGLTFGTGAHPSTQMVMEAMEQTVTPGMHCLDLGSGSGILSIAALRLGAFAHKGRQQPRGVVQPHQHKHHRQRRVPAAQQIHKIRPHRAERTGKALEKMIHMEQLLSHPEQGARALFYPMLSCK